jgi:RNA polymerase sigma-70 factor, ECF subfamily
MPAVAMASPLPFDFDAWMRAEQRRVYLLCLRMMRDPDEADMAAQDSFLKAYRYFADHPAALPVEDATRWITRVAVNTCLDRLRSRSWKFWRRRMPAEGEATALALVSDQRPSAADQLRAGEIKGRLAQALEQLSPRQKAIFVLRHYEDKKLDEIGEILGLETGTVKAHMARAVARLRTELADLYEGA